MKRTCILTALTAFFLFIWAAPLRADSARDIMKKYTDQFELSDETNNVTMKLVNRAGKEQLRRLTIINKRYPDDLHKILIRFTYPEKISGTGLLISENTDRGDDQWLYLPALKKTKKISSQERSHSFMGSEFTYEDLRGEVLKDYNYEILGNEIVDGAECYKIKAVPVSQRKLEETGYGKRILMVRKDISFAIKTEYYDKSDRLLKTEATSGLKEIKPGVYRMNSITMENNLTGDKTILRSDGRIIESGLPSSRFTIMYLEQGA